MTLRLTVHRGAWLQHVHATMQSYGGGVLPVVKGNGYGFGRPILHDVVAATHDRVCVGTVHELHDVPPGLDVVVLTPTLSPPADCAAVLTVANSAHVEALDGWNGRVTVKLRSSMHRYGVTPDGLHALLHDIDRAGLNRDGFVLHLALDGTDEDRRSEAGAWLRVLPPGRVSVSHLGPDSIAMLRSEYPDREIAVRLGTALWHGSPRGEFVHLGAVVLDAETVAGGEPAGYRHVSVPGPGTLLAIGAGSAHGVTPLEDDDPDRRSPFHFARQRLTMLERPHMHTTICFVPEGQPCPRIGDVVDVQQPLVNVRVDEIEWRP